MVDLLPFLAGDDFAFLAQQNSLDNVTSQNGGELGFFTRNSLLVPEVKGVADICACMR